MNITNLTSADYWFGPHHLPPLGSLTLDDTTDTSLYLTDDAVADAVNTLYQSNLIQVASAAVPFPRPTGVPTVTHGDGSPQGKIYAGQGSLYLRRDNTGGSTALFAKTSGVTFNNGWAAISDPWTGLNQTMGLQASTFPVHMANGSGSPTQKQALAGGVWLNAGTTITGLVVNSVGTSVSLTAAYLGIYSSAYTLQAETAESHSSFTSTPGWVEVALTSPYIVPTTALYYFAFIFVGSTTPEITYISGAGSQASQANPIPQYPYFAGSGTTDTTLLATATPTTTSEIPWIGAY